MRHRPRPFDIVHVSSAHPWTDNRVHLRAAASAAAAGFRTALVAVSTDGSYDRDWGSPDPRTGVYVRRLRGRARGARLLRSTTEAIRAAVSSRAAVVHLHDPELVWAIPLLALAGRKVVYDAHEDLPAQVRTKEYLGTFAARIVPQLAAVVLRVAASADAIVAATPAIARRFPAEKTVVVRNFPRLRAADAAAAPPTARDAIAVYLGSLSRDRGIDVLAAAASSDRLPEGWRIHTAGPIDRAVDSRAFDEAVDRGRIKHHGVLDPAAARDLLLGCRVGLVPLAPTESYRDSIPTKLFEYLAAGLGVVASDIPFWREMLDGYDCVIWVPPRDPTAVVEAITAYAADTTTLERHASIGRQAVRDRFRWEAEHDVLLALYRRLLGADPLLVLDS